MKFPRYFVLTEKAKTGEESILEHKMCILKSRSYVVVYKNNNRAEYNNTYDIYKAIEKGGIFREIIAEEAVLVL